MKTHQIRRLPVVNEKHEVVDILSLGDLVRKADLEAAIVPVLQSICEPMHSARKRIERGMAGA
jgi:CBS-domain-containing membrane protein